MKTELEKCLDILGWQGGTIHQVEKELDRLQDEIRRFPVPIALMNSEDYTLLLDLHAKVKACMSVLYDVRGISC